MTEKSSVFINDHTIQVRPASAPDYNVIVQSGWSSDLQESIKKNYPGNDFIITHEGLERDVLEPFLKNYSIPASRILKLPRGEKNKHISNLQGFYNAMIDEGVDRQSAVIALGGGVIGDFAGFISATILRGVGFIQIPTTLLAAVDSSVGGKTAVNVDLGKNMVGAFYHPSLVQFNIDTLLTLPDREWDCGIAEIAKHACMDPVSMEIVRKDPAALRDPHSQNLREAVLASVAYKAGVVNSDEREAGLRSILNLGHTTAHAIESATGYKKFNHGEAVSRGLVTAILISMELAGLSESDAESIFSLLKDLNLPLDTANQKPDDLIKHMKYDKKNRGGEVRFVLLEEIGKPVYGIGVSADVFTRAWEKQRGRFG